MTLKNQEFKLGITLAVANSISLGISGIVDKIGATQSGINPFTSSHFYSTEIHLLET
jgi:hypothetical protein